MAIDIDVNLRYGIIAATCAIVCIIEGVYHHSSFMKFYGIVLLIINLIIMFNQLIVVGKWI